MKPLVLWNDITAWARGGTGISCWCPCGCSSLSFGFAIPLRLFNSGCPWPRISISSHDSAAPDRPWKWLSRGQRPMCLGSRVMRRALEWLDLGASSVFLFLAGWSSVSHQSCVSIFFSVPSCTVWLLGLVYEGSGLGCWSLRPEPSQRSPSPHPPQHWLLPKPWKYSFVHICFILCVIWYLINFCPNRSNFTVIFMEWDGLTHSK